MAESTVEVDLLNPGQVFACLGLMELADELLGSATAAFKFGFAKASEIRIRAQGEEPPIDCALRFLEQAEIESFAPRGTKKLDGWKASWGTAPTVDNENDASPVPAQDSPATVPLYLADDANHRILFDYWADGTRRDKAKFWAGAGGYPGAAILRDALDIVRGKTQQHSNNPFALSGVQTSSFRLDWRRDYIPLEVGFSPNKHADIQMVGYPLVEILAAIGLTHSRPLRDPSSPLKYSYGVLGTNDETLLDPSFHRAALGAKASPVPGMPFRRFAMNLGWPGQEGQARCITEVYEEEITQ